MKDNYNGDDIKDYDEVMAWLAKQATWNYSRYLLHSDGQTSCERQWNRHYDRSICQLAEARLYRPSRKHLPKAEAQWHYGIRLGKCTLSDKHYIGTAECISRPRDIKRLPKSERHQVDYLGKVVGTPWQPRGPHADYPFFVLPKPPADILLFLMDKLRRDTTATPTADTEGNNKESGELRRPRDGDDGVERPPTGRRSTSPSPRATTYAER